MIVKRLLQSPKPTIIYLDSHGYTFDFIAGDMIHTESKWVKLSDGTMCCVTLERSEWQN